MHPGVLVTVRHPYIVLIETYDFVENDITPLLEELKGRMDLVYGVTDHSESRIIEVTLNTTVESEAHRFIRYLQHHYAHCITDLRLYRMQEINKR
jgi:hypothetical protein